jgi:ADP-ribose pyrophosphatase
LALPEESGVTKLFEERIRGERVLDGRFLKIDQDDVKLPDGKIASREYVRHPGAVVVVPWLDSEKVILVRQYRYPLARVFVEFPAGKLDDGEAPLTCGARELLEETGYRATEIAYVGAMHNAVAYSDEIIHIAYARGLVKGKQALDEGEFVECFSETLGWLSRGVRTGEITDAKTITCLHWALSCAPNDPSLAWQRVFA